MTETREYGDGNRNGRLVLRTLRSEDEDSFRRAVAACDNDTPPWAFAFEYDDTVPFGDYVRRLEQWSRGLELPRHFVPNTFFVGVVDEEIVGRLSLRHCLNDFLASIGGHIGYCVIPSQRNRGYATAMLRLVLPLCASRGMMRVLLTCDEDNPGSRRVIEKCGGLFEGMTNCPDLLVQKRRYWVHPQGG